MLSHDLLSHYSKIVLSHSRYPVLTKPSLMTQWHGNVLHIPGPLSGESTNHRWIPLTKSQQWAPFRISSFSGCTRLVEHSVEVPSMGDPIRIWPSGGPALFSTQSALLRLTVASQLWGATLVYFQFNLYLFCCYSAPFLYSGVLAPTSDCFLLIPKM